MNRFALELAAAAVLLNMGRAPFPTVANKNVLLNSSDDLEDWQSDQVMPSLNIYTTVDNHSFVGPQGNATNVDTRYIDLVFELTIWSRSWDEDGKAWVVGWPALDSSLDAMLSLFEYQVLFALFYDEGNFGPWFRKLFGQQISIVSSPLYTRSNTTRLNLAMRDLALRFKVPRDCFPKPVLSTTLPQDSSGNPVVPIELPDLMKQVFNKIESQGTDELLAMSQRIRSELEAQRLPRASYYPPLLSTNMGVFGREEQQPPTGQTPAPFVVAEVSGNLPTTP